MASTLPPTPPTSNDTRFYCAHFHSSFQVHELIGSGGWGIVYKVSRTPPREERDEFLALKVVPRRKVDPCGRVICMREWDLGGDGLGRTEEGRWIVPREAAVLRRYGALHEGLIRIEELFADETYYYFVFEYFGQVWKTSPPASPAPDTELGSPPFSPVAPTPTSPKLVAPPMMHRTSSDLFGRLEYGANLTERQARYVFAQLVDVVLSLAGWGVAHCDIKDENVLIDSSLRIKLIDFGSCQMFDPRSAHPTANGRAGGRTTSYSCPELLLSPRARYEVLPAEVWSLGVVLYILLTRDIPFHSKEEVVRGTWASRVGGRYGEQAEEVFRGCFKLDVRERWTLEQLAQCEWLQGE